MLRFDAPINIVINEHPDHMTRQLAPSMIWNLFAGGTHLHVLGTVTLQDSKWVPMGVVRFSK